MGRLPECDFSGVVGPSRLCDVCGEGTAPTAEPRRCCVCVRISNEASPFLFFACGVSHCVDRRCDCCAGGRYERDVPSNWSQPYSTLICAQPFCCNHAELKLSAVRPGTAGFVSSIAEWH